MKDNMDLCYFVSDLHGLTDRYEKLFDRIKRERPSLVLFGGDLFPHGIYKTPDADFVYGYLYPACRSLQEALGRDYPEMLIILGNDDPGLEALSFMELERTGIWKYIHQKKTEFRQFPVYGYAFIPPTPFRFKDWERFDVSRYVDPGCISPMEGIRSVDPGVDIEYTTIQDELNDLVKDDDLSHAVFLFHSPPYKTYLDRADLDNKFVDHVPMDVHVGSIAIKRFIEERQPWLTLHGHIHESTRLTGHWQQQFGRTISFNAAHDGPELALVEFDINHPAGAKRLLL